MRPFVEASFWKLEHVRGSRRSAPRSSARRFVLASERRRWRSRRSRISLPDRSGSSGSFSTAFDACAHRRRLLHPGDLAELACEIRDRPSKGRWKTGPVPSRLTAACLFNSADDCQRRTVQLRMESLFALEITCCCSSPGFGSWGAALAEQKVRTEEADAEMLRNLHCVKLGFRSRKASRKATKCSAS